MGLFDKEKIPSEVDAAMAEEKIEGQQDMVAEEKETEMTKKKGRKMFAIWEVAGEVYRLKLTTTEIVELESRYKTNLMNIMGTGQGGMPALSVMLDVTHAAMKKMHHGIGKKNVQELFSKYIDEGGSQLEFYTSVYMDIFAVSGFFSASLTDQMQESLEDAKEIM